MTVDSFSDKLSAYIDGELPEADRVEMEQMIAESPACSAMYEDMVALQKRLGNLPKLAPSAEFEFGLRSRIMMEAANEARMRSRVKQALFPTVGRSLLTGAVAAMLALGVSVLLEREPAEFAETEAVNTDGVASAVAVSAQPEVETDPVAVTAEPIDQGALKQLSKEESFALSRRLYRARSDSPASRSLMQQPRTRPVSQRGQPRPVPVSF